MKISTLNEEWRKMKGWKEWRCGENWELYWVDWIIEKYPDFCVEYGLDSIKSFLNGKITKYIKIKAQNQLCPTL